MTASEPPDLLPTLQTLAEAEAAYRHAHDHFGTHDMRTGRAWDLMRRAGDKARAILAPKSDAAPTEGLVAAVRKLLHEAGKPFTTDADNMFAYNAAWEDVRAIMARIDAPTEGGEK